MNQSAILEDRTLKDGNLKGIRTHEKVIYINRRTSSGILEAYIAIHNTKKGPAIGGTRFTTYSNSNEALRDALRLSKAMTYKCALANLPFGGGKGVIIDNGKIKSRVGILNEYAKEVNKLNGQFITGEDVGLGAKEVRALASSCQHIVGKPDSSGLPGPAAALGVFYAMRAALKFTYNSSSLRNRKVAVKGVGAVGAELVDLLIKAGAVVIISDVSAEKLRRIRNIHRNIKVVPPDEIAYSRADIYAPCALGDEFDTRNVNYIKARIICGAANNQLHSDSVGKALQQMEICYIPDYVSNSGGLIHVADELNSDGYKEQRVRRNIRQIQNTVHDILTIAKYVNAPTAQVANEMAERKVLT